MAILYSYLLTKIPCSILHKINSLLRRCPLFPAFFVNPALLYFEWRALASGNQNGPHFLRPRAATVNSGQCWTLEPVQKLQNWFEGPASPSVSWVGFSNSVGYRKGGKVNVICKYGKTRKEDKVL